MILLSHGFIDGAASVIVLSIEITVCVSYAVVNHYPRINAFSSFRVAFQKRIRNYAFSQIKKSPQ